jgi:cell envelope opacity-associated protein A
MEIDFDRERTWCDAKASNRSTGIQVTTAFRYRSTAVRRSSTLAEVCRDQELPNSCGETYWALLRIHGSGS